MKPFLTLSFLICYFYFSELKNAVSKIKWNRPTFPATLPSRSIPNFKPDGCPDIDEVKVIKSQPK